MLTATRSPFAAYRCEKGCWWEEGGCYCPNIGVRSLSGGDKKPALKLIAGMAILGSIFWVVNKVR